MLIRAAGQSDAGRVRESNQDHFCLGARVAQGPLALELDAAGAEFTEYGLLLAVADGMGGYAGGEIASRAALEALAQAYYANPLPAGADGLTEHVRQCLALMLEQLVARLRGDPELAQAGTTLAGIALAAPDLLCVFHAGDSRVLRFAGGANGFLRQLTIDHTPIGHAAFAGELSDADAAGHPLNGQLTRSLGLVGNTEVQVDCGHTWAAGDVFLLCTDGFHGTGRGLPRVALQDALRQCDAPETLVPGLVGQAVENDGADNTTAVIALIAGDEQDRAMQIPDGAEAPLEGTHAGG
jgi:PPM family protein phosphatase